MDMAWPGLIAECASAMQAVFPRNCVSVYRPHADSNCMVVFAPSNHVVCLFPQHGRGMKHLRRIELADWQQPIVSEHASAFVRGLLHSDGCRFTNPVTTHRVRYEYPRYMFSNASKDILSLFARACDGLGVEWRRTGDRTIAVSGRDSVSLLDQFVGPKY
jgi:hypothetical protein